MPMVSYTLDSSGKSLTSKATALFHDDHIVAIILQQVDRRTHAAYTGPNDDDGGVGHSLVAHLPLN